MVDRSNALSSDDASSRWLAIGDVIAEYRVLEHLGCGGMSQVYRVEHVITGGEFALKLLDPARAAEKAWRERFKRELGALQLLRSEHILRLVDGGVDRDRAGHPRCYIVTELACGSLRDRLEADGPLLAAEVLRIADELLCGLGAAHALGFIHRDIKPDNLFDTEDGRLVVGDFGLAFLTHEYVDHRLTTTGAVLGTFDYVAPELRDRGAMANARSDLYAVGVTLYELLTGRLPQGKFALPSETDAGIPPTLDGPVVACLEQDPARRPTSCKELRRALRAVATGDPPYSSSACVPAAALRRAAADPFALPPRCCPSCGDEIDERCSCCPRCGAVLNPEGAIAMARSQVAVDKLARRDAQLQDRAREAACWSLGYAFATLVFPPVFAPLALAQASAARSYAAAARASVPGEARVALVVALVALLLWPTLAVLYLWK